MTTAIPARKRLHRLRPPTQPRLRSPTRRPRCQSPATPPTATPRLSEAPESSDESDAPSAADEPADEPAEPAEPASIDYAGFGLADEDIELELVRQFEEANPNISVSDVDMLTSRDYWPRMEALAAAGNLPCVMWMNSGFVDSWILDGLIVDIQAYVDQLDHSLYQIGDFAGMRNPQTGNMHAFPFRFGGSVLYYNATLFTEAGLPLPERWMDLGRLPDRGPGPHSRRERRRHARAVRPLLLWALRACGELGVSEQWPAVERRTNGLRA